MNRLVVILPAVVSLLAACSIPAGSAGPTRMPSERDPSCADTEPLPVLTARARRVVLVTIDGLGSDLVGEDTPVLNRLAAAGHYSPQAYTVLPSLTLPAHMSIATGTTPEEHGVTWNGVVANPPPLARRTVFDVLRAEGKQAALFSGKPKLAQLVPGGVAPARTHKSDDAAVVDDALRYLDRHDPDLLWVHLPSVDRKGHSSGWGSERQRRALQRADAQLGRLVDAYEALGRDAGTAWIVTADHGGHEQHHREGEPVDRQVPWIASGAGLRAVRLPPVCVRETGPAALQLLGLPGLER
jgi:predicted AlkP superfamily pyrophosphatase or phosphodiesterase